MTRTDIDLQRERTDHQIVADALASVRLFHALYGQGEQTREWIAELARTLHRMGCSERTPERESILANAADAIARTYLRRPASELDWPQPGA